MKTVNAEQFTKLYGIEAAASLQQTRNQPARPSYINRVTENVGTDIFNRSNKVNQILSNPITPTPEKGLQLLGQGAGLAANTLETAALEIPGARQVVSTVFKPFQWIQEAPPIKALGNLIGSSKVAQTATQLYDTDQNFKSTVDAVANVIRLGGDVTAITDSANFAANVTNKLLSNVKNTATDVAGAVSEKATQITEGAPANIMNRVARLKPTDATAFEKLAGKTHGQYLADTGNFGSPDKIIENEAVKFTNSKNGVDMALSRLPGLYKPGAVRDALASLVEKAKSVSTEHVLSGYLGRARELLSKFDSQGLTMAEINEIKRLFERNVKLGYNKLLNADKIEQATNVDSAIRKWQVSQADRLGFTNIADMNKQTQLSKFIIDKLGDQIIGKSGLNNVSLTDWIVLAGGNPSSVAGFITKRFFSSKGVQARIAEMLNSAEIQGPIQPEVKPTLESALRGTFPQGTRPELPAGTNPTVENRVPIQTGPASSMEAPAQQINNQSLIRATQTKRQQLGKGIATYGNGTTIPKELQQIDYRKYITDAVRKMKIKNGEKVADDLVNIYKAAEINKPIIDRMITDVSKEIPGSVPLTAPLKGHLKTGFNPSRAIEKFVEKINTQGSGEVLDIARNSLLVNSMSDATRALESLVAKGAKLDKGKDFFAQPTYLGYRGINLRFYNKGVGSEIQIQIPEIMYYKQALKDMGDLRDMFGKLFPGIEEAMKEAGIKPGRGHEIFEFHRNFQIKAIKEGRYRKNSNGDEIYNWTPEEDAFLKPTMIESQKGYKTAMQLAEKRAKSMGF